MGEPVEKVACPECGKEMYPVENFTDNTLRGWLCFDCWTDAKGEKGWIRNKAAHHDIMERYGFKVRQKSGE